MRRRQETPTEQLALPVAESHEERIRLAQQAYDRTRASVQRAGGPLKAPAELVDRNWDAMLELCDARGRGREPPAGAGTRRP